MTPCIEVHTDKNSNGYPRTKRNGKRYLSHRLAYVDAHGPIPDGKLVRHKCDNPTCVNVEHLELGTQSDNQRDSVARGRQKNTKKTHCPSGHEYNEINTRIYQGRRYCRVCERQRVRTRK